MARTVLGIGSSHGPLLNTPPEQWGERGKADRRNPALWYQGQTYDFEGLLARRGGPTAFAAECAREVRQARAAACEQALVELGQRVQRSGVDVLVVVSSDHGEVYGWEMLPHFSIYWGQEFQHVRFTEEQGAAMAPGLAIGEVKNYPDQPTARPGSPELAVQLIQGLAQRGFDVAGSRAFPAGKHGNHSIPHGWGFIYQRVLNGASVPMVPLFVNTYFPPTKPSAARCYQLGRALGEAIDAAPANLKVGVVASGGLSHFVVDEDLDRRFLEALRESDGDYLSSLDDPLLQSGTAELLNWTVVAGACDATGLRAEVVDYVPCYRTEAGTGCAMGFVAWEPTPR